MELYNLLGGGKYTGKQWTIDQLKCVCLCSSYRLLTQQCTVYDYE